MSTMEPDEGSPEREGAFEYPRERDDEQPEREGASEYPRERGDDDEPDELPADDE